MKLHYFLFALLFSFVLTSCGKDSEMEEMMEEETLPYLKVDLSWDPEFAAEAGATVIADSFPTSFDITWENPVTFDIESEDLMANTAVIAKEDPDDDYQTIFSSAVVGNDTTLLLFEIYGDLEVKSYNYASQDILAFIFSGEGEIPAGTVIPYLLSEKSQAAVTPLFMTLFGAVDFSGSNFEITEINAETNEVSGTFNVNFVIPADDGNSAQSVVKLENGAFNKVLIVQ